MEIFQKNRHNKFKIFNQQLNWKSSKKNKWVAQTLHRDNISSMLVEKIAMLCEITLNFKRFIGNFFLWVLNANGGKYYVSHLLACSPAHLLRSRRSNGFHTGVNNLLPFNGMFVNKLRQHFYSRLCLSMTAVFISFSKIYLFVAVGKFPLFNYVEFIIELLNARRSFAEQRNRAEKLAHTSDAWLHLRVMMLHVCVWCMLACQCVSNRSRTTWHRRHLCVAFAFQLFFFVFAILFCFAMLHCILHKMFENMKSIYGEKSIYSIFFQTELSCSNL